MTSYNNNSLIQVLCAITLLLGNINNPYFVNAWSTPTATNSRPSILSQSLSQSSIPNTITTIRSSSALKVTLTEVQVHDGDTQHKEEEEEEEHDETTPLLTSPGILEDDKFDCDESVFYWRNFQNNENQKDDYEGKDSSNSNTSSTRSTAASWQQNAMQMADITNRFTSSNDSQKLQYFVKHVARSGYFVTNALLGNAGFQLHERLIRNNPSSSQSSSALPFNLNTNVGSRILLEALLCYEQDYDSISKGFYKEPWDMKDGHRQSSPINVVTQTGRFVQEAIGTLVRRNRRNESDAQVDFFKEPQAPSFYPQYYRNAFHYQTNGEQTFFCY